MSKLIHPGEVSDLESLTEILRSVHADAREGNLAEMKRRDANSSPHDDTTRWENVTEKAKHLADAVALQETAKVREIADSILLVTTGALSDPGEYSPPAHIEGVKVRMQILTAREMRVLTRAEARAREARRKLIDAGSPNEEIEESLEKVVTAQLELVGAILRLVESENDRVEVSGAAPMDEQQLAILERSGLLIPLFEACCAFQDLPWGKGGRSGSQARPTSSSSTAAPAPQPSARPEGASAAP